MSSQQTLSELCQVLSDRLKCKMCKSGLRAGKHRWYSCQGDHKICQDCMDNGKCWTSRYSLLCLKSFSDICSCGRTVSPQHCKMTEDLLKTTTILFNCSFVNRGCGEKLVEASMLSHEKECIYRPVRCPRMTCKTKVPYYDLLQHLANDDKVYKNYGMDRIYLQYIDYQRKRDQIFLYPMKFIFDQSVFIFTGRKDQSSETLFCWLQLVGSRHEAKNYVFTLEFHGHNSGSVTYTGSVFSIDDSYKSISEGLKCYGMNYGVFKTQFLDEDGRFKVSVSIQQTGAARVDQPKGQLEKAEREKKSLAKFCNEKRRRTK